MKVLTDKEYLGITVPFMLSTMTQPLMGAVNTAVMGQMSMNLLNCVLSIWFVTCMKMGNDGVAWATLL